MEVANRSLRQRARIGGALWGALAAASALLLAVALVGAGFVACASPAATWALAQAASAEASSPYGPEALVRLAGATRAFTVDPRGAGEEAAEGLAAAILAEAQAACAEGSPTTGRWTDQARAAAEGAGDGGSALEALEALAAAGEQYALDPDALRHLDDCNRLISGAAPWLAVSALGAAAGIAALAATGRRRLLGAALAGAPCVVLAALAALGGWGALDFNGLFGAFHAILFPQGNWTFPARSLLITMYPLGFWEAMAGIWLGTTGLLAIISLALGMALARKKES